MKNKRRIIIGIICTLVILVFLPLLLDIFIFSNNYISKVSNDGWAGFLGGYIGGIIGGIVTLIAMIVPLKQTQKQIEDAERKDKLKERKKITDEIATLVLRYISDLQIYRESEEYLEKPREELANKYTYFVRLQQIWKRCYEDRYFEWIDDYFNELGKNNVSEEYPKRFFEQCDMSFAEKAYREYEEALEHKIAELKKELKTIEEKSSKYRQKYLVGNNTYLLLELKLQELECGKNLWKQIFNIQDTEIKKIVPWRYLMDEQAFEEKIQKLKEELGSFVKKYLEQ